MAPCAVPRRTPSVSHATGSLSGSRTGIILGHPYCVETHELMGGGLLAGELTIIIGLPRSPPIQEALVDALARGSKTSGKHAMNVEDFFSWAT